MSNDHQYLNKSQFLDNNQENNKSFDANIINLSENYKNDDELLIDLVRSFPYLWNKQDRDFRDSSKKNTSWEEITAVLNLSSNNLIIKFHKILLYFILLISFLFSFIILICLIVRKNRTINNIKWSLI